MPSTPRANVYWLTLSPAATGLPKRMAGIDGTPCRRCSWRLNLKPPPAHEADELYGRSAPGADGVDRWFFNTYVPGDGWDRGWVPTAGDPIPFSGIAARDARTGHDHDQHVRRL